MTNLINIEAEQAVLGALLVNNEALHAIGLKPEDFGDGLHAAIYAKASEMISDGRAVSPVTLRPIFENDPAYLDLKNPNYLLNLADHAVMIRDVRSYARIVGDLAARRAMVSGMEAMLERIGDIGADERIDNLLADAEAMLFDVSVKARVKTNTPKSFGEALARSVEKIGEAYHAGEAIGYSWGLPSLDKALGKFARGEVTVIAGRPSMGKTAVAGSIALSNALEGNGVLIESLEMQADQIALRCTSDALKRGGLSLPYKFASMGLGGSETAFKQWLEKAREIEGLPLHINDTPTKTLSMVRSSIIRAQHKMRAQGVELTMVFVDYLQLLESGKRSGNRTEELSQITRSLKDMAKEFDVAMVPLSQLSRRVEDRDNKRPLLSDLRESGSIEQDADRVVMVYRHDYYLSKEEPKDNGKNSDKIADWAAEMDACKNTVELIGAKIRMGATQTAATGCVLSCNYFHELNEGMNF